MFGSSAYTCPCDRWQVEIADDLMVAVPLFGQYGELREINDVVSDIAHERSKMLDEVMREHALECEILAEVARASGIEI